jgi:hypothetical protein
MTTRVYFKHETCMGRGYVPGWDRGKWRLRNCAGCSGSGEVMKVVDEAGLKRLRSKNIQIRIEETINETT